MLGAVFHLIRCLDDLLHPRQVFGERFVTAFFIPFVPLDGVLFDGLLGLSLGL